MRDSWAFGAPMWLLLLLLLVVLVVVRQLAIGKSTSQLDKMVASRLKDQLLKSISTGRRRLKFIFAIVGLLFCIIAMSMPRHGTIREESTRRGLDVVIAFDTSRSMLAQDVKPDRLTRAKLAVQDLVRVLQGDRLALVAFAGEAFLQCPLTIDYGAFITNIDEINTDLIPVGGTNLSRAIEEAMKAFSKSEGENRALIIISDGEELDESGVAMARRAMDEGIRIFTLGMGSEEGAHIPLALPGGGVELVKDSTGEYVLSKLDESILRQISEVTGGFYVRFDGQDSVKRIIDEGFSTMEKEDIDVRDNEKPIERYQWPLGVGLLFLILSAVLSDSRKQAASVAALLLLSLPMDGMADAGRKAYLSEAYESALDHYKEKLLKKPNSAHRAKLDYGAGTAALKAGKFDEAIALLSSALLTKDEALRSQAYYNLGNALYQKGSAEKDPKKRLGYWSDALAQFNDAFSLTPQDDDVMHNRDFARAQVRELAYQTQPCTLGDLVFEDTNANGLKDPEEKGLPGVTLELRSKPFEEEGKKVTTDADGRYQFAKLYAGEYILIVQPAEGFRPTQMDQGGDDANDSDINEEGQTSPFILEPGEQNKTVDAGFVKDDQKDQDQENEDQENEDQDQDQENEDQENEDKENQDQKDEGKENQDQKDEGKENQDQKDKGDQKDEGDQKDKGDDSQEQGDEEKEDDSQGSEDENQTPEDDASQDEQGPVEGGEETPQEVPSGNEETPAADPYSVTEDGKMSEAAARALLESLQGEEAKVPLRREPPRRIPRARNW